MNYTHYRACPTTCISCDGYFFLEHSKHKRPDTWSRTSLKVSRQHHVCVKGCVLAHIQEWRQQVHTHPKSMICENRTSLEANYHSFGWSFADDQDWVHLGKAGDCFNSDSPGFLCCSPAGLPESDRGCWLVEMLFWLLLLCCWCEVFLLFVEPVAALSCCIATWTASSALATSGLALTSATFWEEPDHLQHGREQSVKSCWWIWPKAYWANANNIT